VFPSGFYSHREQDPYPEFAKSHSLSEPQFLLLYYNNDTLFFLGSGEDVDPLLPALLFLSKSYGCVY
jgi:hypothetical protein